MHPILFEVPVLGFKVHGYGLMMFFGCASALAIAVWRARREGLNTDAVYELATWLFLGGVVGARALFVASRPDLIQSPLDLFRSWEGGNVFYGCIIGGLTGTLIYWRRHPFPFLRMADAVAPALAVGVFFGRFGCHLNGCCHGAITQLPWGIRFPAGSHAWTATRRPRVCWPPPPPGRSPCIRPSFTRRSPAWRSWSGCWRTSRSAVARAR